MQKNNIPKYDKYYRYRGIVCHDIYEESGVVKIMEMFNDSRDFYIDIDKFMNNVNQTGLENYLNKVFGYETN